MSESIAPFAVPVVVVIGLLGAAVGSFLNVVIYRIPRGLSVVSPPSACPACGAAIRRRDNVPVVSWLVLRGRCRDCAAHISARYPIIETLTALLFVTVVLRFGIPGDGGRNPFSGSLVLVAFLYLMAVSVALAAIDLDVHRLPNAIVVPAYLVGAVLLGGAVLISGDIDAGLRALCGAAILFVFYFALAFAHPGGMGFGDVKLAGVLGLFLGFLGWPHLIVGAAAAFFLGGVAGLLLIFSGKATRKSGIPFGPWMLIGAWVGVYAGEPIVDGYLSLVGLN